MADMVIAELDIILYTGAGSIEDPQDPHPADPTHFGLYAQVLISEGQGKGSDSFNGLVCSPSWLAEQLTADRWKRFASTDLTDVTDAVSPLAGIWLMRRWSRDDLETAVRQLCDICSPGPDWGSVASRIGRLLPWEYDYRYDDHVDKRYGELFPPKPRSVSS